MRTKYLDKLYLTDFTDIFDKKLAINRSLKVETIKKGMIFPVNESWNKAGILNEKNERVELANFEPLNDLDGYKLENQQGQSPTAQTRVETVIYLGAIRNHWGHFLMDSLARLWFPVENHLLNTAQFVYFGEKIQSKVMLEFFDLLGIKQEQLHFITQPTIYEQIIVPEAAFIPGKYVHSSFLAPFNQIIEMITSAVETSFLPNDAMKKESKTEPITHTAEIKNSSSKIYLSRQKLKATNEWGEDKIEQLFTQNDFTIVYPETLSLIEQIKLIHSAKQIACLSGTLPHTLVFAQENTEIFILNKSYKRQNYRQAAIDEIKALKVTYIDAHISLAPVFAGGPFWIKNNQNLANFCAAYHLSSVPHDTIWQNLSVLKKYLIAVLKLYFSILRGTKKSPVSVINRYNLYQEKVTIRALFSFYISSVFKK